MGSLRNCAVSFTDQSGVRHSVEVAAQSLYEAVALGLKAIDEQWGEAPGLLAPIEVKVQAPVTVHQVTLKQVRQWADGFCRSPKEKIAKDRVKEVLGNR